MYTQSFRGLFREMDTLKRVFNANLSPSPGKGRWYEFLRQFFVLGQYRGGSLVGTDKAGNRYYEINNEKLMFPCKSGVLY